MTCDTSEYSHVILEDDSMMRICTKKVQAPLSVVHVFLCSVGSGKVAEQLLLPAGQQQKIPEALLMGDNLAAEAEEKGRERIWNKLQLHAEQFSSAYRGMTILLRQPAAFCQAICQTTQSCT